MPAEWATEKPGHDYWYDADPECNGIEPAHLFKAVSEHRAKCTKCGLLRLEVQRSLKACSIDGCEEEAFHCGLRLCHGHWLANAEEESKA